MKLFFIKQKNKTVQKILNLCCMWILVDDEVVVDLQLVGGYTENQNLREVDNVSPMEGIHVDKGNFENDLELPNNSARTENVGYEKLGYCFNYNFEKQTVNNFALTHLTKGILVLVLTMVAL